MRKLRSAVVGTVLAGALAAGVAAAPAQAATASASSAAAFTKHWFSGYSGYSHGESRGERSFYKGYWYYSHGRYYFDISVWDRDHDGQYTYLDFWYHDNRGWHDNRLYFTKGGNEWNFDYGRNGGRLDGFRVRLGEGTPRHYDWGGYSTHSF